MIKRKNKITIYNNKDYFETLDDFITEYKVNIHLNNKKIAERYCINKNLHEMIIGFLLSENHVKNYSEIKKMIFKEIDEYNGEFHCTLNEKKFYKEKDDLKYKIKAKMISDTMKDFTQRSILFKETGGVHSCGILQNDRIIYFAEDIGRLNTLDKSIGYLAKNQLKCKECVFLFSGRVTLEVINKLNNTNILGIISKSAVTYNSQIKGKEFGLLIIGFARKNKFNIYSGKEYLDYN